jgi:transmembrane sensor
MSEASNPPRRTALEAARWHERLAGAPQDSAHQAAFARWRDADPDAAAEFEAVGRVMGLAKMAADEPGIRALRAEAAARTPRRRRRTPTYAIAAGLAVSFVLAGLVSWQVQRSSAPPPADYETQTGERMSVTLADGSVVTLNTRSRVRAVYTRKERRLFLDAGEAVFEVAKDRDRPFDVVAGGQVVTAHGTTFDVRLEPGRVDVALFEGSIVVKPNAASRQGGTQVRPGQRLTIDGERSELSAIHNLDQALSWRRGVVIFEDATLAEAVAEMNRYSDAKILIADTALAGLRLSGSFRTDGSSAFVEALELYFPLRAKRGADASVVLVSRQREAYAAAG